MKFLIIGENALIDLTSFNKSIFTTLSLITSIYARQIAAVTPNQHTAFVLENKEQIDYNKKYDCILIHFKTGMTNEAYNIADEYRKTGTKVIFSGTHTTALPEEAKEHADSIFIGSAELLWPIAIKDIEKSKLKKAYNTKNYRKQKIPIAKKIEIPQNQKLIGIIEAKRGCGFEKGKRLHSEFRIVFMVGGMDAALHGGAFNSTIRRAAARRLGRKYHRCAEGQLQSGRVSGRAEGHDAAMGRPDRRNGEER